MPIQKKLFDGQVMHAVLLRRLESGAAKRIAALARASLEEVLKRAMDAAVFDGVITTAKRRRLNQLIKNAQSVERAFSRPAFQSLRKEMGDLADYEVEYQGRLYKRSFAPLALSLKQPSPAVLRTAAFIQPFQGSPLSEWRHSYTEATIQRATRAMRMSFFQGEGQNQLAARLLGAGGRKGVLQEGRRGAEAIARTALNHAANVARDKFQADNPVGTKYRYTATLDGRTTFICGARDGRIYTLDDRPRLPPT